MASFDDERSACSELSDVSDDSGKKCVAELSDFGLEDAILLTNLGDATITSTVPAFVEMKLDDVPYVRDISKINTPMQMSTQQKRKVMERKSKISGMGSKSEKLEDRLNKNKSSVASLQQPPKHGAVILAKRQNAPEVSMSPRGLLKRESSALKKESSLRNAKAVSVPALKHELRATAPEFCPMGFEPGFKNA